MSNEEHPEMKPYWFEVVGKVYAANESHANHFVYWAIDEAMKYRDASAAQMMIKEINLEEIK